MRSKEKSFFKELKDYLVLKLTFTHVIILLFIIICVAFLVFAFKLPFIFADYNEYSSVFYQAPANFSATLYNSLSPFIAFVAAILTFMAFWMQYNANQEMFSNYEDQRKNNAKQEFEHQFYEMLRIHKENVKELKWDQWSLVESSNPKYICEDENFEKGKYYYNNKYAKKSVIGREVFEYLYAEFYCVQAMLKNSITVVKKKEGLSCDLKKMKDYKLMLAFAYEIFFEGKGIIKSYFDESARPFFKACDENLEKAKEFFGQNGQPHFENYNLIKNCLFDDCNGHIYLYCYYFLSLMREKWESYSSKTSFRRDFSGSVLFKGHIFDLNHYYRHLYQMVKIVANYNESIVEKKEKRKYLRMLRAQLTRIEQLMLFFNWLSDYGRDWENDKNHFFTTFRMIHNLFARDLIFFEKFGYEQIVEMIKRKNQNYREYENDYLFEFEERMLINMRHVYDRLKDEKNAFVYGDLLPYEIRKDIGGRRYDKAASYLRGKYGDYIYYNTVITKDDYKTAIKDIQNYITQMFVWED